MTVNLSTIAVIFLIELPWCISADLKKDDSKFDFLFQ